MTIKIPDELVERVTRASEFQKHDAPQLLKILIEWALVHYETTRSVEKLRNLRLTSRAAKR